MRPGIALLIIVIIAALAIGAFLYIVKGAGLLGLQGQSSTILNTYTTAAYSSTAASSTLVANASDESTTSTTTVTSSTSTSVTTTVGQAHSGRV
jgi:hypothetical protein